MTETITFLQEIEDLPREIRHNILKRKIEQYIEEKKFNQFFQLYSIERNLKHILPEFKLFFEIFENTTQEIQKIESYFDIRTNDDFNRYDLITGIVRDAQYDMENLTNNTSKFIALCILYEFDDNHDVYFKYASDIHLTNSTISYKNNELDLGIESYFSLHYNENDSKYISVEDYYHLYGDEKHTPQDFIDVIEEIIFEIWNVY